VDVDFDVDWSVSPLGQSAPTLTYRAPGRPTGGGGVPARTSPVVGGWTPLSVDTYSREVTASVQPGARSTPGRDSPRPVVIDIEVGRRLPDNDDDDDDDDDDEEARPVQRLTTMPRPDTPSNVWSVETSLPALSTLADIPRSLSISFPLLLLLLRPFNYLFSRTTWVSRHQKGKPFCILLEQEMMAWQWHQWTICTSCAPRSRQIGA